MSLWELALTLFLVANPIGNVPAFLSLVKQFDFSRQKAILFRESIFSFLLAIFFLFVGERFLEIIQIEQYAVSCAGGMLLFIVALRMIFPPNPPEDKEQRHQEPFIVPIATPLISGGGVLSTMMILSAKEQNNLQLFFASCIAWLLVTIVVVSSAYLQKLLGKRGLVALEQLMGMILSLISMEIIVKGITVFLKEFH